MSKGLSSLVRAQRGLCTYCGRAFQWSRSSSLRPTVDHIVPTWDGGRNCTENRCACCYACNQAKGAMDAATFRRVRLDPVALKVEQRRAQYLAAIASRGAMAAPILAAAE
jgi:5-methylcytosine-specific restriction endonuclease McrA